MGWGPHLKHSHLPTAAEQGYSHTQPVGTEAVALPGRGEVEPLEVGDVAVSVQDGALSVTELGTGAWCAAGTRSRMRMPCLPCAALQDCARRVPGPDLCRSSQHNWPRMAPGNET